MLESLHFHYNGIASSSMNVVNVKTNSSLFEEVFMADREVIYERIKGRDKSYLFGVELEPLKFGLTFAFSTSFTDTTLRQVAAWFDQSTYKPFYFDLMPNRIIYCMLEDEPKLIHTGKNQGYIELKLISNSPYYYGSQTTSLVTDLSTNPSGTLVTITNDGDVSVYPEMWINKVGVGNISIVNESNGDIEFAFTDLADSEEVYIDNENQDIITDILLMYRYDDFNNNYLYLIPGENKLRVYGTCTLQFRYSFKYLQGCEIIPEPEPEGEGEGEGEGGEE